MKLPSHLFVVLGGCLILSICPIPPLATAAEEEPAIPEEKQDHPSKERMDAALHLMQVKGSRQQTIKGCLAGLDQQRSINPAFTEALYLALKEEMTTDENIDALILMIASNFAKRFTVEELNELSAFYGTAIGKRVASEEADLAMESMDAGRKWGMELGEKVDKALQKKKDLR